MGSITNQHQQDGAHTQSRRIYLLTSPRTASNLFVRILNIDGQPEVRANSFHGGYFYMPSFLARDQFQTWNVPVNALPEDQKKAIGENLQAGTDAFKSFVESTEAAGKIPFVKEHVNFLMKPALQNQILHGAPAQPFKDPWEVSMKDAAGRSPSNPTFLPDDWLHTFKPVILIRHPALSFPSQYRAEMEGRGMEQTSNRHALSTWVLSYIAVRQLYDFYCSHFLQQDPESPWPLVIEASEFITNPEPVMYHFCDVTGIDKTKLKFNWEAASKEQIKALDGDPLTKRFLSTLNSSTGILKDKALADVNIDTEAVKWRAEFGDETGRRMEGWVRDSVDDYEYLRSHRWSPPTEADQKVADGAH